jgi:hypothetical protein
MLHRAGQYEGLFDAKHLAMLKVHQTKWPRREPSDRDQWSIWGNGGEHDVDPRAIGKPRIGHRMRGVGLRARISEHAFG